MDLSTERRAALTSLATLEGERLDLMDHDIINLCLVLLDEKPLAEFTVYKRPADWTTVTDNTVLALVEQLDVEYYTWASFDPADEYGDENEALVLVNFEVWLDDDDETSPDPSARIGVHKGQKYGYPQEAVEAYTDFYARGNESFARKADSYRREQLEAGMYTAEALAYLEFVNWVPPMNPAGLDAAIDTGKRRYTRIREFARENNLPMVARRIRGCYESERLDYERGAATTFLGDAAEDEQPAESDA